jgi:steroid 5-alpha reductase family enzyme
MYIDGILVDHRHRRGSSRLLSVYGADTGSIILQIGLVYAVQHAMLVGLLLPWQPIATSSLPWTWLDTVATIASTSGLLIAWLADNSLHRFVSSKMRSWAQDRRGEDVLRTGLWGICRHPNHFGEQLWWWGAALFAVAVGGRWTLMGTAFNSACMLKVCLMGLLECLEYLRSHVATCNVNNFLMDTVERRTTCTMQCCSH